ncbi:hypothetical protein BH09ACT5_BH09ACT5_07850 [soil metagenome]
MPECIHGLEIPLCDACYPKAQPEKAAPAPRTPRAPRSTRVAGVATSRKSIDPATQRVYHVTHISNLESILDADQLIAGASPTVDVSTALTRELRLTAEVAPGRSVADYVPFYLAPTALRWDELRHGAEDETRWSAAARTSASVDFVVLVTTVSALGPDAVVADGDAAASLTRFATGEEIIRALTRLHDTSTTDAAEVLAREAVPFSSIQLIGVANDRVRDRVRELTSTKVAVYPPWFQAEL